MKRLSLSTGLVAAAMALSAAPLLAAPFTCPTRGGDLVFGQEANVNSLDQMTSSTISTRNIAMNIYETLITRDENNKPIPELAESMQESPDGMSYTFKLRQGITFHNGKALTPPMSRLPLIATIGLACSAARWIMSQAGKRPIRRPSSFA